MAIQLYNESTITKSKIYNDLNDLSEIPIPKRAAELITNSRHLKNTDIESSYIAVKQISDSLTRAAIKAYDSGQIVLVYNEIKQKTLSQAIPFLTLKHAGEWTTYLFVDKWVKPDRNNVLTIASPVLWNLLCGAVIARGLKLNYANLTGNPYLTKTLMDLYTQFFTTILNREYQIMVDKPNFEIICYYTNKFFLKQILGSIENDENIERLAASHARFADEMALQTARASYDQADPQDFDGIIALVKNCSPRMRTLIPNKFVASWVSYYYAPVTLAIDNIEYLIFMVLCLYTSSNIANIGASGIVRNYKGINQLRQELLKLI